MTIDCHDCFVNFKTSYNLSKKFIIWINPENNIMNKLTFFSFKLMISTSPTPEPPTTTCSPYGSPSKYWAEYKNSPSSVDGRFIGLMVSMSLQLVMSQIWRLFFTDHEPVRILVPYKLKSVNRYRLPYIF